ncbi:signal recognition particle protein [Candidatus Mycoplasma haematolamae str. Purdue]|uniref:signal-recognition-particle GTPase n=1 Tax=Mycoplasma haematolamae (strain Purdue) TaxID=1212765 RepID=I7CED8_MYCHA|nr:signal recognition particle receptor subunit alpha [Candidatus Mycoplasma haematolamae]AFO51596.1 signal recognition particle protein [Candidatus Mycoplasma haematolamae str. Purdue]
MLSLNRIIQKVVAKKIKHNFLAKMIGEKEMDIIFSELKDEFLRSDVNFEVTTSFFQEIREEIKSEKTIFMGKEEVQLELYNKIKKKLIESLGLESKPLKIRHKGTTKFFLVGTNGSGKTTTAGKLVHYLQSKQNMKSIETVSLDVNRAAAFEQLTQLVEPLGIKSHFLETTEKLTNYEKELKTKNLDAIIYDSGGILPKDSEALSYLRKLWETISPTETIMIIDALAGQESLEIVKLFADSIPLDSLIVTKSDSQSPLGAALSAHYFLKVPIKFLGEGEAIKDLVPFYPDRIVSRLLGEGDVQSLAESIEDKEIDIPTAERAIFKFLQGKFDLEDLMVQLREIRKFGSLKGVLSHFPSLGKISETLMNKTDELEVEFKNWETLIQSMTPYEKKNPKVFKLESSRRTRVIKGSGRKPEELNKLISRWEISKKKAEEIGQKVTDKSADWTQIFDYLK